ncbi:glycosyltransferase [Pedobacter frigoris]|uniref:Glycosyltransferase family 2 protein n=1 Tax=Pedobacter frigoris TaxID=2571272 RepID=A0A4V5P035_9SPHI|nr:glycosyltransferase [Pedobacter frigoris]TKC09322.1 glycosyltransferase family 2 protein [Pedobacter frigoris]
MILYNYLWIALQLLIGFNLVFPFFLYVLWKIRLIFQKRQPEVPLTEQADYAIIVTAYQQTDMLPYVVSSILKLNYSNYLIYVVADNCDVSGLDFNDERVVLLRPPETLASNTRSHFYAINHFHRPHERLTIIDSDNLVEPEYLNELNHLFNKGFKAVQGVRKAKNLDSTFSCLDAARDIYYHFYDGKVLFELQSSATLSGSGMAFTTALYKECLEHLDITGAGFDKVLQAEILKRNYRIAFTEDAVVYDEKTSRSDQLVKQRARWINTWFKYFKYGFTILGTGLQRMSINQILFGIVLLRPPLFMFILASGLFLLINIFISLTGVLIWAGAFFLFALGFYIALLHSNADSRIYKSLINIPKFIYFQLISLLKSRNANKTSIATTHYHGPVNDN